MLNERTRVIGRSASWHVMDAELGFDIANAASHGVPFTVAVAFAAP